MVEIEEKIRECMAQIQHCRSYVGSTRTNEMVNSLMRVEKLASSLNKEGVDGALKIVNELYEELSISMYSGYVSATIDNLRSVREQLEQAGQEFSW